MYPFLFFFVQLKLHHVISHEIMIYPGYVPEPGVKYRVFHYGLDFRVGNWSFDKADWREVDLVNKCWAKFPDPPDPSEADQSSDDAKQRDLLSIECGKTLNEALRLHHERRKCGDPTSKSPPDLETIDEGTTARKFGQFEESNLGTTNNSASVVDSSLPEESSQTFLHFRFWMIFLWASSVLGFGVVMTVIVRGRKGQKKRGKGVNKSRKRSLQSGFWDVNDQDRTVREAS